MVIEVRKWLLEVECGKGGLTGKNTRELSRGDGNVFITFSLVFTWGHTTIKTQEIEHLKYGHFIAYKLYLKKKVYRKKYTHKTWIERLKKLKNETKKNICNKGLISRIQKQLLKSTGKITRKTRKSQPERKKPKQRVWAGNSQKWKEKRPVT